MNKQILKKVREKIGEYYQQNTVEAPKQINKREFGAGNQNKINFRHLTFKNQEELNKYLVSEKPRFISHSTAYYQYPDKRPMEKKQSIKGDLTFDLDSECSHNTLTCYQCLEEVKQETEKLVNEFLVKDFGYDMNQIDINFSGNKGYHVKVKDSDAQAMDGEARKEIIDYVMANELVTPEFKKSGPRPEESGWRGKIASEILRFVKEADRDKMKELGINNKKIRDLIDRRKQIMQGIKKGNYDMLMGPEKLWKKVMDNRKVNLQAKIDHPVTMDTSRLIRVPNTIHGGSSLIAKEIEELHSFKPFQDALVFGEEPETIKITKQTPKIHLNGESHGPYEEGKEIQVPEYVAMFLASKEHAQPKW